MYDIFWNLLKIRGVRKKDIDLLKLYACEHMDAVLLEKQFTQTDFEHEPYRYNLALSRLGSKYGWENIPGDLVPRLKGIHLKENTKFVYALSKCQDFFERLNEEHIDFLVLNESALKLLWLSNACHQISQFDIIAHEKYFDRCCTLALKQGFMPKKKTVRNLHFQSYKCGDDFVLNIHRRVYRNNIYKNEDFSLQTENAGIVEKKNAKILVSGIENVYLQLMINGLDKLVSGIGPDYDLFFIADLIDLRSRFQIDKDKVLELIEGSSLVNKYTLAVRFLDCVLPGFFSFEKELAGKLNFRENVWKDFKLQAERIIKRKEKGQTRGIFRRYYQSFYCIYAYVDVLYLLDYNKFRKFFYFIVTFIRIVELRIS